MIIKLYHKKTLINDNYRKMSISEKLYEIENKLVGKNRTDKYCRDNNPLVRIACGKKYDKYVYSSMISRTDELRELATKHFKNKGVDTMDIINKLLANTKCNVA